MIIMNILCLRFTLHNTFIFPNSCPACLDIFLQISFEVIYNIGYTSKIASIGKSCILVFHFKFKSYSGKDIGRDETRFNNFNRK